MPSEEECVRYAAECWESGLNCAESALRGVCHGRRELPEVALRMATPFGGGLGRCEDLCGALSGAAMGIGANLGRVDGHGDKFVSYRAVKELRTEFVRRFGSSSCRELNKGDFKSPEHEARCKNLTLEAVRMACRVLDRR
ncbi:MAG: C-GCAxxG-C-C family protein [Methanomassiliicoccales archaeon]|jgi:C_GCAxxG_C_C family probable redox protein|nr:C-GCAxxG-C-C family protein [Methanomassiliicoccales archaeon]